MHNGIGASLADDPHERFAVERIRPHGRGGEPCDRGGAPGGSGHADGLVTVGYRPSDEGAAEHTGRPGDEDSNDGILSAMRACAAPNTKASTSMFCSAEISAIRRGEAAVDERRVFVIVEICATFFTVSPPLVRPRRRLRHG